MIFIIPIILGAAALVTAGLGVSAGADGISKMQKAEAIGKKAQKRHKKACKSIENTFKLVQNSAEEYGQLQIEVKKETVGRFIAFIERLGQTVSQKERVFLKSLEGLSPEQIREYKTEVLEAERFAKGGIAAVGAASAASQGTLGLIGLFGTASTGTAISGLSGAAAWNATLAWLGGGSLAAGGGGMALGAAVLTGIAVGPALMIGGFVLGGKGEEALTKALKYKAEANVKIARLKADEEYLMRVQRRVIELKELVSHLSYQANILLTELESKPFDRDRDADKFQKVLLLVKALTEIMKVPILDKQGKLNKITESLKEKYGYI
jgi:hypothetical protein